MFKLTARTLIQTVIYGTAASLLLPSLSVQAASIATHVLIISVDGLDNTVLDNPDLQQYIPNIRSLEQSGITYTNAQTTSPSDSFPGTTAILTGANPATAGVYYDDTYSRTLTKPISQGGNSSSTLGTEVQYAENIDYTNSNGTWNLSGGGYASGNSSNPLVPGNYGPGSIDPTQLVQNCSSGTCKSVQPWNLLQNGVNTIYSVANSAGLTTAFSDKHAGAYNIAQGPGGAGTINEYYSPEINASVALIDSTTHAQINPLTATQAQLHLVGTQLIDALSPIYQANPGNYTLAVPTDNYALTTAYDTLKANGVAGEYKGINPVTGTTGNAAPNLSYINFQGVSVAEKALDGGINNTGPNPLTNPKAIVPSNGSVGPSQALINAVQGVDTNIGNILNTLQNQGLSSSTLVVLTAKHGQDPVSGVGTLLSDKLIPDAIDFHLNDTGAVAQATQDDVSLVWLKDQSQIANVTTYLQGLTKLALCNATSSGSTSSAPSCNPGIKNVYSGAAAVAAGLSSSTSGSTTPDIFIQTLPGYVFVGNPAKGKKIAEHGGLFTPSDVNVPIIVSGSSLASNLQGTTVSSAVKTTQIAPTVLADLGLNPNQLVGVQLDGTKVLPTVNVPEPTSILGAITALGLGAGIKRKLGQKKAYKK